MPLNLNPVQLVKGGYCDPIRLFVKQEPHTRKKVEEGRFRLISSVSVVDQVVERLLFGPQNQLEITQWRSIPSKPGMGLSLAEQASSIWHDLAYKHQQHPAAEADISGFDWSVQDWELWADLEMRLELGGIKGNLAKICTSRFYCFMNSVFQLSNGDLIAQGKPGLMKSGSYCTSSTNSRIRCLMAEIIGAPWCIAMGDDSVEGFVPDARDKYRALGHLCKDYISCETSGSGALKRVNFCSHELTEKSFFLTTWPKTLYRFLCNPMGDIDDLHAELWGNPKWGKIENYIHEGRHVGKATEENGIPEEMECSLRANQGDRGDPKESQSASQQCEEQKTSASSWDGKDQPRIIYDPFGGCSGVSWGDSRTHDSAVGFQWQQLCGEASRGESALDGRHQSDRLHYQLYA